MIKLRHERKARYSFSGVIDFMVEPAPEPFDWLAAEILQREQAGLMRRLVSKQIGACRDFASNDYLGLRRNEIVVQAGIMAAVKEGSGSGSSPAVGGWKPVHVDLAKQIAEWKGAESALLFTSGYLANQATTAALVGAADAIYLDRLAHACLVYGARLSGAKLRVFSHNNAARLEELLRRDLGRFRRRLIITESLFSMDGDTAPLTELSEIAANYHCMMLVDEAHATGFFGPEGQGLVESLGLAAHPNIVRTGTLSKAIGSQGGFVVGSKTLVDWLVQSARGWIYATAIAPFLVASASAAIDIIRKQPEIRAKLHRNSEFLRQILVQQGWAVPTGQGPIVPLVVGEAELAVAIGSGLWELGFAVGAIRPPTVPRGTARLRISVSAAHSEADIEALVEALGTVANQHRLL